MKKLIIVVAVCIVLLTGCAQKIDYNKQSMFLSLNMNKNEVTQILGTPRRTDVNTDRERWIYWNKVLLVPSYILLDNEQLATDRLVVTFVNGKVTKWGQQTMSEDGIIKALRTN